MTDYQVVEMVKALAWPVTALIAAFMLKVPLADMARAIGSRATKLSAFKVEIELATLSQAKVSMETAIRGLRSVPILESAIPNGPGGGGEGLRHLAKAAVSDYVLVHLGEEGREEWLTSRLFLLVAILERSETLRAIVFTGSRGEFVGAASPRDIRVALGNRFPEYEAAIARGHGSAGQLRTGAFRGGPTGETMARVASSFMDDQEITSRHLPLEPVGWIYFGDPYGVGDPAGKQVAGGTDHGWEFAEWVRPDWLRVLLGHRLDQGQVSGSPGGIFSEAVTRDIVRLSGSFVALAGQSGIFNGLCDRRTIIEAVARRAIDQVN